MDTYYLNIFLLFTTGTSIIFSIFLFQKLQSVKASSNDILEILDDIANGNDIHKLLANPKDITAAICYKINDIVDSYQEQLIEMTKARETNKQLMTSLSHDLRTPLTTLIGYLDAVKKGIVIGNEKEQYIETARLKAHDMKEYVDMLFECFKLNSNEETFTIQPIELSECTRNILKDWIPVFENTSLDFDIDIPEQKIVINIDIDAYSRILNNLIQNVILHSHASTISINICKQGKHATLCIYDNGVGISKQNLPHIFERLYKCDKARSEKGSGLGLSIVWQLVKKMNGTITVDSEVNKQTVFNIQFPLSHMKNPC